MGMKDSLLRRPRLRNTKMHQFFSALRAHSNPVIQIPNMISGRTMIPWIRKTSCASKYPADVNSAIQALPCALRNAKSKTMLQIESASAKECIARTEFPKSRIQLLPRKWNINGCPLDKEGSRLEGRSPGPESAIVLNAGAYTQASSQKKGELKRCQLNRIKNPQAIKSNSQGSQAELIVFLRKAIKQK